MRNVTVAVRLNETETKMLDDLRDKLGLETDAEALRHALRAASTGRLPDKPAPKVAAPAPSAPAPPKKKVGRPRKIRPDEVCVQPAPAGDWGNRPCPPGDWDYGATPRAEAAEALMTPGTIMDDKEKEIEALRAALARIRARAQDHPAPAPPPPTSQ